jgi:hypothetical protein
MRCEKDIVAGFPLYRVITVNRLHLIAIGRIGASPG